MNKTWIVVITLVTALIVPAVARAHEHDKTVMGTVSKVDGSNLMVTTADGKTIMVMMDAKTKITKGATKLEAGALKVGDRIVAAGPEDKNMIMAETVKVGEGLAPPKVTQKS